MDILKKNSKIQHEEDFVEKMICKDKKINNKYYKLHRENIMINTNHEIRDNNRKEEKIERIKENKNK